MHSYVLCDAFTLLKVYKKESFQLLWNRESFTDNGGLLRFSSFIANNFNGPQQSQKLQLRSKVKSSSAVGNRDKIYVHSFVSIFDLRHLDTYLFLYRVFDALFILYQLQI